MARHLKICWRIPSIARRVKSIIAFILKIRIIEKIANRIVIILLKKCLVLIKPCNKLHRTSANVVKVRKWCLIIENHFIEVAQTIVNKRFGDVTSIGSSQTKTKNTLVSLYLPFLNVSKKKLVSLAVLICFSNSFTTLEIIFSHY